MGFEEKNVCIVQSLGEGECAADKFTVLTAKV
jgi:hypothetical protein